VPSQRFERRAATTAAVGPNRRLPLPVLSVVMIVRIPPTTNSCRAGRPPQFSGLRERVLRFSRFVGPKSFGWACRCRIVSATGRSIKGRHYTESNWREQPCLQQLMGKNKLPEFRRIFPQGNLFDLVSSELLRRCAGRTAGVTEKAV